MNYNSLTFWLLFLAVLLPYWWQAAALEASPGPRIAVVGNSTLRSGVDGDALGKLVTKALDRPVSASLLVADSAEVTTWHFMLPRLFWRPRLEADMVVLPTASSRRYEVPDALVATVEQAGMTFLDDRVLPELPPDLFPDGLHLADDGKAIYTPLLATERSPLVAHQQGPGGARPD
jgi:hypothetical protein